MLKHLQNLILLCLLSGTAISQTNYEVIDLGTLGGNGSSARSINNSSQVVGISLLASGQAHAFLWDDGTMTDLGTLGGITSEGWNINNLAQVVGSSYTSESLTHAFLWDSGVMIDLGTLGGDASAAQSINDSTQIVGVAKLTNGESRAFLWQNGNMINLGTLAASSVAKCINNLTQVVGYSNDGDGDQAFLWENGQMIGLGTLGGIYSRAFEINELSQIVGNSQLPDFTSHAFLWENGTMQSLGILTGTSSYALAINDLSQIVGYYVISGGAWRACIWQDGSAYDLNDLIDPNSGWILSEARDINNEGEIVGVGLHNGQTRGFLLRPNTFEITSPVAGEKWIAGETDTIKWIGGEAGANLSIELSTDGGNNYFLINSAVPADSNKYIWSIPDSLLSTRALIKLTDNSNRTAESDTFKIKGYVLTRLTSDGNYEAFEPNKHGWNYLNGTLWPESWWAQFIYAIATDPYTNELYPSFFFQVPDSSFIDWPLWVEVFSTNRCYWSTSIPVYNGSAQEKWRAKTKSHNGSCFGFAGSSFLAFNFRDQFFTRHPGIPNVSNIFSLNLTTTIQKTINGYYAYQYGKQSLDNDVIGMPKDPRTTLVEIMNMFKNDVVDISTITIFRTPPPGLPAGAHTMSPIKVVRDNTGTSRYRILLYDSNRPGLNTPYILIDSLNNTWQDSTGLGVGWNGNSKCYLEIPVSNYLNNPVLVKTKSNFSNGINNIEFYNTEKADIIYTSSTGEKIGVVDGNLIDEIDDGISIINKNGKPSDPIGYYIPDDIYSVVMNNMTDSTNRAFISVFKEDVIYSYERYDAESTQTDRFNVNDGFSVASPDLEEKQISLTVIARLDSSERILFIQETQLIQNDSLFIKELNQSDFIIKNFGTSKNYKLEINERSETELDVFQNASVELSSNSSHIIVPEWQDLINSQLTIYVDEGNDGTVDDTLYIANTVDVKDEGNLLSPNEYNLAQNYPNPFNPVTTIRYSIPQRNNVSLKVYDILGNEIATLVNEEKEIGVYSVNFNAFQLSSGIYLYRIQAGSFVETKKMILVK